MVNLCWLSLFLLLVRRSSKGANRLGPSWHKKLQSITERKGSLALYTSATNQVLATCNVPAPNVQSSFFHQQELKIRTTKWIILYCIRDIYMFCVQGNILWYESRCVFRISSWLHLKNLSRSKKALFTVYNSSLYIGLISTTTAHVMFYNVIHHDEHGTVVHLHGVKWLLCSTGRPEATFRSFQRLLSLKSVRRVWSWVKSSKWGWRRTMVLLEWTLTTVVLALAASPVVTATASSKTPKVEWYQCYPVVCCRDELLCRVASKLQSTQSTTNAALYSFFCGREEWRSYLRSWTVDFSLNSSYWRLQYNGWVPSHYICHAPRGKTIWLLWLFKRSPLTQ